MSHDVMPDELQQQEDDESAALAHQALLDARRREEDEALSLDALILTVWAMEDALGELKRQLRARNLW